jgi:hypothetical protein
MNRPTATRLRVEFDGPDVSQEMLYTLFRVSTTRQEAVGVLSEDSWGWLIYSHTVKCLT